MEIVGGNIILAPNQQLEKRVLIKMKSKDIKGRKTPVKMGIFADDKEIDLIKFSFSGPGLLKITIMKLTWGHGITIAIIAFMAFIIYMVVQTFQLDADLVQDDFYEQEVLFDEKKISIQNYSALADKIEITQLPEGIQFQFPKSMKDIEGKITFYRPDDKKLDKDFEINLSDNNVQRLDYNLFREGRYSIIIKFTHQNMLTCTNHSINF